MDLLVSPGCSWDFLGSPGFPWVPLGSPRLPGPLSSLGCPGFSCTCTISSIGVPMTVGKQPAGWNLGASAAINPKRK